MCPSFGCCECSVSLLCRLNRQRVLWNFQIADCVELYVRTPGTCVFPQLMGLFVSMKCPHVYFLRVKTRRFKSFCGESSDRDQHVEYYVLDTPYRRKVRSWNFWFSMKCPAHTSIFLLERFHFNRPLSFQQGNQPSKVMANFKQTARGWRRKPGVLPASAVHHRLPTGPGIQANEPPPDEPPEEEAPEEEEPTGDSQEEQ